MKLFTIPNIVTLGNLLCGCLAIVCAFDGNLVWSAYLVGIAAVLDFFDGFLARKLNQHSPVGKDLDSLADMVTFGVVPAVVMFHLLNYSLINYHQLWLQESREGITKMVLGAEYNSHWYSYLPYVAFLVTLFSALRLAKFNNDTRQSDSFIGVPTPANSILLCSIPLIYSSYKLVPGNYLFMNNDVVPDVENPAAVSFYSGFPADGIGHAVCSLLTNPVFLIVLVVVMCYLLISEIPLFALKFKSFGWKGNEIRYSFLALCVVLLATMQFVGIPLTILVYILMSVGSNLAGKKKI